MLGFQKEVDNLKKELKSKQDLIQSKDEIA